MAIHIIKSERDEEGIKSSYEQVDGEEPSIGDYGDAKREVRFQKRILEIFPFASRVISLNMKTFGGENERKN